MRLGDGLFTEPPSVVGESFQCGGRGDSWESGKMVNNQCAVALYYSSKYLGAHLLPLNNKKACLFF